MIDPPKSMGDKSTLLKEKKHLLNSPGPKGRFLRRLYQEVKSQFDLIKIAAKERDPLMFFKPSYEQALMLNAWMYGISFICIYTANRIGKTTACIINILLWLLPNNPKWLIFKPYIDHKGRKVQVFPRPHISNVKRIRKFFRSTFKQLHPNAPKPNPRDPTYTESNQFCLQSLQTQCPRLLPEQPRNPLTPCYPEHPWPGGGTIWFGAPDHDHHEKIMFPLWKQYLPTGIVDRYSPSQKEITLRIVSDTTPLPSKDNPNPQPQTRITVWNLVGKSYESKDTKWSSGAVDIIMLTEGVDKATMKEVRMRFKDPGVGSHDFTPYEAANEGAATHLAHQIYKGKFKMPLSLHVFTKFSMLDAPEHIMTEEQRQERIAASEGSLEYKARIEGEFYTSSGLVLSNLDKERHLLPFSKEQFDIVLSLTLSAMRQPQQFRGIDPGLDHPTATTWAHLLPSNQWVVYRMMCERNLTIPKRCKRIIELSNNVQSKIFYEGGPQRETTPEDDIRPPRPEGKFYKLETHPNINSEAFITTIADYHTFKEDEVTGHSNSLNYILQGLQITESVHMGPEDRAVMMDGQLEPSQYLPDLMPPKHIQELMHAHNRDKANSSRFSTLPQQVINYYNSSLQGIPGGSALYFLLYGEGVLAAISKWEEFYWERKKSGDDKGAPKDTVPSHEDDELDATAYLTCSQYKWTNVRAERRMVDDSEPENDMIEFADAHQRVA